MNENDEMLDTIVGGITKNPIESIYDGVSEIPSEEEMSNELKPLTPEQRAILDTRAIEIYNAAIKLQDLDNNYKGDSTEVLFTITDNTSKNVEKAYTGTLAQPTNPELAICNDEKINILDIAIKCKLISNKLKKDYDKLPKDKKKETIKYLKDSIIETAQQISIDLDMKEMNKINNMMPLGLAGYYFINNDELFNYDPENKMPLDNKRHNILMDGYKESLFLTELTSVLYDPKFHKGLRKRINHKYESMAHKCNAMIVSELKNKDSKNNDISYLYKYIMKMFPTVTEIQAKAYIAAIAYKIPTMGKNKLSCLTCYLYNMNTVSLVPFVTEKEPMVGSCLDFYNSLSKFFVILKEKNKSL
jgi:hypothetical protein